MNLIEGQLTRTGDRATFQTDGWEVELKHDAPAGISGSILCGFRPEDATPGGGPLTGEVLVRESLGDATYLQLRMPSKNGTPRPVVVRQPNTDAAPLRPGATISFDLIRNRLHWFDPTTGSRLPKV